MSVKKWLPLLIVSPLVLLIDQLAKWWVLSNLNLGDSVPIIAAVAPYIQITRATNAGIAFGIGENAGMIFTVLPILITGMVLWMYTQSKLGEWWHQVSLAMIIGGAIGNIIDRLRFEHVIDFVHVYIPGLVSNVSNFADHFIVVGVIILLIDSFLQDRPKTEDNTDNQTDSIIMIAEE